MAKRHLDEIDNYDYLASNSNLPEVVVTTKAPYSYWDGFDWYTATDTGERKKMGANFNPNGTRVITDPKQFEQIRLANAAKKDINRTHEFGENIRNLATQLVMTPGYDILGQAGGAAIGKGLQLLGKTKVGAKALENASRFGRNLYRKLPSTVRGLVNDANKLNYPEFNSSVYYQGLNNRTKAIRSVNGQIPSDIAPSESFVPSDIRDAAIIRDNDYRYTANRLTDEKAPMSIALGGDVEPEHIAQAERDLYNQILYDMGLTGESRVNRLNAFSEDPRSNLVAAYRDRYNITEAEARQRIIDDYFDLNPYMRTRFGKNVPETETPTLFEQRTGARPSDRFIDPDMTDEEYLAAMDDADDMIRNLNREIFGVDTSEPIAHRQVTPAKLSQRSGKIGYNGEEFTPDEFIKKYIDSNGKINMEDVDLSQVSTYDRFRIPRMTKELDRGIALRGFATKKRQLFERVKKNHPEISLKQPEIWMDRDYFRADYNGNSIHGLSIGDGAYDITGANFFHPEGDPNGLLNAVIEKLPRKSKISLASKSDALSTNSLPLYIQRVAKYLNDTSNKGLKITPTADPIFFNSLGRDHYKGVLFDRVDGNKSKQIEGVRKAYGYLLDAYKRRYGVDLPLDMNMLDKLTYPGFDVIKLRKGGRISLKNGGIYIKPENRGKFNATKERTGKTTEELTHSKNPLTRKRAIFAQNAAKWKH